MTADDEWQPILAELRRLAAKLDDYHLDERIAVTAARRDVAAAWRYPDVADLWQEQLLVLDDVRRGRAKLFDEMLDAANPVKSRPLTAEELAEDTGDGDA